MKHFIVVEYENQVVCSCNRSFWVADYQAHIEETETEGTARNDSFNSRLDIWMITGTKAGKKE